MLDIKRALKSAVSPSCTDLIELSTPWGEELDSEQVLSEHPRPTMERERYAVLNGWWECAVAPLDAGCATTTATHPLSPTEALDAVARAVAPQAFDGRILVPFSPEAPLSGADRAPGPGELFWYRRRVALPALGARERLILHFEAVDWTCAVWVNGQLATTHTGAYLPFEVDITPYLDPVPQAEPDGRTAELAVCVYDPGSAGTQLRGKQSLNPGGIWYTAQSGIWQSVWYEVVPEAHITAVALEGDSAGALALRVGYTAPQDAVLSAVVADAHGMARARGFFNAPANEEGAVQGSLTVGSPRCWSPDDPYLYTVRLRLEAAGAEPVGRAGGAADHPTPDRVKSYCAFRSVCVAPDEEGTPRFFLNGEPLFLRGALDQGYWPDGLMTAPADEALVHDIQEAKRLGFNLLRKHIKVESARWYYHADRLGMLVWQDVPSGGGAYSPWWTSRIPTALSATWGMLGDTSAGAARRLSSDDAAYRVEWQETCTQMVQGLAGHPSIVGWSLFNEGWGQFDAAAAAEHVHALDPTRPIDAASGWFDQRAGDVLSIHNYFRPLEVPHESGRLQGYAAERGCRMAMLSEFGGLTRAVEGHAATPEAYGYGDYDTLKAWRAAVRAALAKAEELEAQGLAGYVYTQLTDVEGELNGLLTYDRRVNKLLPNQSFGS